MSAELSLNEKRVLLALKDLGEARPEEIMEKGNFKLLAEVMNPASWLQAKGLIEIKESYSTEYSLDKEGREYLKQGLPERRVLEILRNKGKVTVSEIAKSGKIKGNEIPIALGWLRKKNWADIKKDEGQTVIEIRAEGMEKLLERGGDEKVLSELGKVESLPHERLVSTLVLQGVSKEEIEESIEMLRSRKNIIREKDRVKREIILTDKGREIIEQGLELKEEVSQLTPEMIQSGEWSSLSFRRYDVNTFAPSLYGGKTHPLTQLQNEIREIFLEMGFTEIAGDFVESCFWNMDVLFIPQDHPARDLQDTFYLSNPEFIEIEDKELIKKIKETHEHGWKTGSDGWQYEWNENEARKAILRTHTTVNTIRYLSEHSEPPVKVFSIGRNFRRESIDSTHLPEFYQIEGIIMEEKASFRMLIGVLKEFYRRMGFEKVRIRPAYFPYTEPSLEVEIQFKDEWLEFGGAGIFRPEVTLPFGVEHPVLAWGLGLERLAMLRLELKDIRELYMSDIEWLKRVRI